MFGERLEVAFLLLHHHLTVLLAALRQLPRPTSTNSCALHTHLVRYNRTPTVSTDLGSSASTTAVSVKVTCTNMKFGATFVAFAAVVLALVSTATAFRVEAATNSDRLARGLPPLRPRNLFNDKRHRALKPRASSLPPPPRDTITPTGSCGCTYTVYSADSGPGTYYPPSDAPFSTFSPIPTAAICVELCNSLDTCVYAIYQNVACYVYSALPTTALEPTPFGITAFGLDNSVPCTGVCST